MLSETQKQDNTDPKGQIRPPSRQHIVNWVEEAWTSIKSRKDMISKSFIVTGISTAYGSWEEKLIRNDDLRNEIDRELSAIFGKQLAINETCAGDDDPFDDVSSSSDSSMESDVCDPESFHSDIECSNSYLSAGEWSDIDSDCQFSP